MMKKKKVFIPEPIIKDGYICVKNDGLSKIKRMISIKDFLMYSNLNNESKGNKSNINNEDV